MTGPSATPRPEQPAQIAIALARSFGSRNTLVKIDRVAGMMNAAPMPMRARNAMSWPGVSAAAASSEPAPKMLMPKMSAPRRPNLSPSEPAVNSSPAKTST